MQPNQEEVQIQKKNNSGKKKFAKKRVNEIKESTACNVVVTRSSADSTSVAGPVAEMVRMQTQHLYRQTFKGVDFTQNGANDAEMLRILTQDPQESK